MDESAACAAPECGVAIIPEMDVEDLQAQSAAELLEIVRDVGELIVDNCEVAQSLVECGFEIKCQSEGEDGTEIVLQVRGENPDETSEEAKSRPPPVEVAIEYSDEAPANFKGVPVAQSVEYPSPTAGAKFKINVPDQTLGAECKRYVQRTPVDQVTQDVYVFVSLTPAYLRNSATQEVTLMLDEVGFGVENCLKEVHCLGHFVHQLEIEVCPSDAWESSCTLGTVRPGNPHAPHPVQHTQTRGWTVGAALSGPTPGVQATSTCSKGISYAEAPYDWLPATTKRRGNKSVTWTWKMNTWQDGRKFRDDAMWLRARELPQLPFPSVPSDDDPSLNYTDLNFDATWEVPTNVAVAMKNHFEWKILVRIHTAVVRPLMRLRYGKDILLLRRKSEIPDPFEFTTAGTCQF